MEEEKKNSGCFYLVKYCISQCSVLWIFFFSFPDPSVSFAVSCYPSSCLHVVKLRAYILEDSRIAVLPFPVVVALPLILFLSVGSFCMQNALKNVIRLLFQSNTMCMYSLNFVGWK